MKESTTQYLRGILKKWWHYLLVFLFLEVAAIVGLFYPESIYVEIWVYITMMVLIAFIIFAIFKWGGSES